MKIKQEKPNYQPITITLENRYEAEAFFSLLESIENYRANADQEFKPTPAECGVIVRLCDAFHGQEVVI